ncbi:MAG TPA: glucose-6-phosphate dehydrogenase assembly protein OpcA [Patescibacteria group bacterium]|nr:glucose-6-phosphate dehydrogenase assembly protein OpcA [Patescibacteria group bacterium]
MTDLTMPAAPGEPSLRWTSRASTIDGIERELAKIWVVPDVTGHAESADGRHIAARTSVMNLVVIARQPELGEHCAAIISQLTGRHPSRTLICSPTDPDGPGWLDARITAHCMLPREDAPETCAETIYVTAGGETGRHIAAIVEPLLIHDLPVTVWWPGEPPLGSPQASDLLEDADRLVIDGSSWTGDGYARLRQLARLLEAGELAVFDFALVRQSRWREAIASTFDLPDFLPFLRSIRRIAVTYGTHDELGRPGTTNMVKPLYHVAWIASRLGMTVSRPLAALGPAGTATASKPASQPSAASRSAGRHVGAKPVAGRGYSAMLRQGQADVAVVMRPVLSGMPAGTTLRVELLAERRGSELRVDVTAEAETVAVHAWQDGVELLDRRFNAARRTETDLLAEAIEAPQRDIVSEGAIRMAAQIVEPHEDPGPE